MAQLPASERIRHRLVAADRRYHANDNIAAFVRAGEVDELKAEVQARMQELLRALVIDTDSDHNTNETPSAWPRCTSTRSSAAAYVPMPAVTEFPNAERLNELMIVGPITRAQRLQPPHVPDLRPCLDRRPAQRAQQPHRPEQVRAHLRLDHEPAADQEEAVTMLANELQQRVRPTAWPS